MSMIVDIFGNDDSTPEGGIMLKYFFIYADFKHADPDLIFYKIELLIEKHYLYRLKSTPRNFPRFSYHSISFLGGASISSGDLRNI